jgi:hypothetical protein
MKTLKAMMMGVALLFVCGITKAAPGSHSNSTKEEVMDTYLNAVVHGKLNGIDDAIDDDATFRMKRGDKVTTLTKSQVLSSLKISENIDQDCECTKTIMQNDDNISKVKVDMKYKDFTRSDVVTARHEGNKWRIIDVQTTYE